jgi:hypothetical protein
MQCDVQNAGQWLQLVAYHDLHYAVFIKMLSATRH